MNRNDYRRWCGVQQQEYEEKERCESPPDRHCNEFTKSLSRLKHIDHKIRSLECGLKDIQRHSLQSPQNACDCMPYQNNNRLSTMCAPNVAYDPTSACNIYDNWNNGEGASIKDFHNVGEVPKGNHKNILCNDQSKYHIVSTL